MLARECAYRFFALALLEPREPDWGALTNDENQRLARTGLEMLAAETAAPDGVSFDALFAALAGPLADAAADHQRVFGLTPARECPPFETEYHGNAEPFFCSQQMADIAGFYRAFGLTLPPSARPDSLPLELEFMAFLLLKQRMTPDATEAVEVCAAAEADFFRDHLAWWAPAFAAGLVKRAGHGVYAELGRALSWFVAAECKRFGVTSARVPLAVVVPEPPEDAAACAACSA
jgi:TorA maturation chaperone TorD